MTTRYLFCRQGFPDEDLLGACFNCRDDTVVIYFTRLTMDHLKQVLVKPAIATFLGTYIKDIDPDGMKYFEREEIDVEVFSQTSEFMDKHKDLVEKTIGNWMGFLTSGTAANWAYSYVKSLRGKSFNDTVVRAILPASQELQTLAQKGMIYFEKEQSLAELHSLSAVVFRSTIENHPNITVAVLSIGCSAGINQTHVQVQMAHKAHMSIIHYYRVKDDKIVNSWSIRTKDNIIIPDSVFKKLQCETFGPTPATNLRGGSGGLDFVSGLRTLNPRS